MRRAYQRAFRALRAGGFAAEGAYFPAHAAGPAAHDALLGRPALRREVAPSDRLGFFDPPRPHPSPWARLIDLVRARLPRR